MWDLLKPGVLMGSNIMRTFILVVQDHGAQSIQDVILFVKNIQHSNDIPKSYSRPKQILHHHEGIIYQKFINLKEFESFCQYL
jgi:hypothetical protein